MKMEMFMRMLGLMKNRTVNDEDESLSLPNRLKDIQSLVRKGKIKEADLMIESLLIEVDSKNLLKSEMLSE